jgi:hypothetical protein
MSVAASSDLPLIEDIPCITCGYNLRSKRPSEKCPECGAPVAPSIEVARIECLPRPRRAANAAWILAIWQIEWPCFFLAQYLILDVLYAGTTVPREISIFLTLWIFLWPAAARTFGILLLDAATRRPLFTSCGNAKLQWPGYLLFLQCLYPITMVLRYLIIPSGTRIAPAAYYSLLAFELITCILALVTLAALWILLRRILHPRQHPRLLRMANLLCAFTFFDTFVHGVHRAFTETRWWSTFELWYYDWSQAYFQYSGKCEVILGLAFTTFWLVFAHVCRHWIPQVGKGDPTPPV